MPSQLPTLLPLLLLLLTTLVSAQTTTAPTSSTTILPTPAPKEPPPPVPEYTGFDKQWKEFFIGFIPLIGGIIVLLSLYQFVWCPWWDRRMKIVEKEWMRLEKERLGGGAAGGGGRV